MRQVLVSLFLAAFVFGCGQQAAPPPPPEQKAAPEPSPEQIAQEIQKSLGVLQECLVSGNPPPDSSTFVPALSSAAAKHRVTDNGKAAIAKVASQLEEVIRQCKEKKRWGMVKASIDAYNALVPNSSKFNRLKEMTDLQLSKPMVKCKAFFVDHASNNQVYAFLELTYRTGEVKNVQVREGEEFESLRFVRIVGDLKGVELEYLPIPGDTFEVMK
jgi:hypothetical protein